MHLTQSQYPDDVTGLYQAALHADNIKACVQFTFIHVSSTIMYTTMCCLVIIIVCFFTGLLGKCSSMEYMHVAFCNAVELQWIEHLWNHENIFETRVVRANEF